MCCAHAYLWLKTEFPLGLPISPRIYLSRDPALGHWYVTPCLPSPGARDPNSLLGSFSSLKLVILQTLSKRLDFKAYNLKYALDQAKNSPETKGNLMVICFHFVQVKASQTMQENFLLWIVLCTVGLQIPEATRVSTDTVQVFAENG